MARYVRNFCQEYASTSKRFVVVMKKMRYRVVKLQRAFRCFIACNAARKHALRKLWNKRLQRRYWPVKSHAIFYHKQLLLYEDYKKKLEEDFNEQARIQAERARRQREESVVQNLDMKLYEKPGRKPLEKHEAKLNTWKTKMKENAIMKKYNKRLDHLRQMLSSLGEYQNAKDSRSGAWDKSVQDDLQKSLGEIAGRRFPRFKRLTQEEKTAQDRLSAPNHMEKVHRNFQVYKIPSGVVHTFLEHILHRYRKWHIASAKKQTLEQDGFNINDIKNMFGFDDDVGRNAADVVRDVNTRAKWPIMRLYSTLNDDRVAALGVLLSVIMLTFGGSDLSKLNSMSREEMVNCFNSTTNAINMHGRDDTSDIDKNENGKPNEIETNIHVDFIRYLDEFDVVRNPIKTRKKKKAKSSIGPESSTRPNTSNTCQSDTRSITRGTSAALSSIRRKVHFAQDSSSGW